jgi:hypothetical protein
LEAAHLGIDNRVIDNTSTQYSNYTVFMVITTSTVAFTLHRATRLPYIMLEGRF